MIAQTLVKSFRADLDQKGFRSASVRMSRLVYRLPYQILETRELIRTQSVQAHHDFLKAADPFFVHAHRDYLCSTLSSSERLAAALFHYRFVDRFFVPPGMQELANNGISLWQHVDNSNVFDIRLMYGNDNMYEGGFSLVFFVNSRRVGLMSLSVIDGSIVGLHPGPLVLVTRNQTTSDRWYQDCLQDAFGHIALPYLLLGSLTGLVSAFKLGSFAAVLESAHPAARNANVELMKTSYSTFWAKFDCAPVRDGIVSVQLPLHARPLHEIAPKHRRRAKARRELMNTIGHSASKALESRLEAFTPGDGYSLQLSSPASATHTGRSARLANFARAEYEHIICMAALRSTEFAGRTALLI
jgi:uncharacterized protein VirK/YbjX